MIELSREAHKHDGRRKGGFNDYRFFGDVGPRPRTCQWIENDPRVDPSKCGEPVSGPSSPYCESHRARCWQPRKADGE